MHTKNTIWRYYCVVINIMLVYLVGMLFYNDVSNSLIVKLPHVLVHTYLCFDFKSSVCEFNSYCSVH